MKTLNTSGIWSGNVYTSNGIAFSVLTDDRGNVIGVSTSGTATDRIDFILCEIKANTLLVAGTQYRLNGSRNGSVESWCIWIQTHGVVGSEMSTTGDGVFTASNLDAATNRRVSITIFANYAPNLVFKPMLRLGSIADDSFEPYSNVCPISGWTGVNVTRTGKNLVEGSTNHLIGILNTNTARVNSGTGTCLVAYLKKGETYTFSNTDINRYLVTYWDVMPTVNSGQITTKYQNIAPNTTFTANYSGLALIYIYNSAVDTSNAQLELGSTATDYEPYSGQTVEVTFPSEAGTVYGGTLNVKSGKLTVDREIVDLGALNWTKGNYFSSGGIADRCKYPSDNNIAADAICSIYPVVARNSLVNKTISIQTGGYIVCSDDLYTDAASFKTAMNGVQFVFELASPLTYELTPAEVGLLLGANVVWADCGPVGLRYGADTKLYVDGKFAELQALVLEH